MVFYELQAQSALLTVCYNDYAFTMDIDLVYMSLNQFSCHFVCGDIHIDTVVGLDWIGSFQASILLLYRECFTLNNVSGQLGSDGVLCAQPGQPDDVCQMMHYFLGSQNESLFAMPDHFLFECAEAHGIDCASNGWASNHLSVISLSYSNVSLTLLINR